MRTTLKETLNDVSRGIKDDVDREMRQLPINELMNKRQCCREEEVIKLPTDESMKKGNIDGREGPWPNWCINE